MSRDSTSDLEPYYQLSYGQYPKLEEVGSQLTVDLMCQKRLD